MGGILLINSLVSNRKTSCLIFTVPVIKSFCGHGKYLKLMEKSYLLSSLASYLFFSLASLPAGKAGKCSCEIDHRVAEVHCAAHE